MEFIRGYFYSAKKAHPNSLSSKESSEKFREICTVNNQIDSNDDISQYINSNAKNKKFNFIQIFKICFILIFMIISLLDMVSYFRHIGDENLIQRYQCEKEYIENECGKITIEDGPIINKFCQEKEICMNIQYSNVYFHSVIIKYLKEIALSLAPTSLYSKIIIGCVVILGMVVIRRI